MLVLLINDHIILLAFQTVLGSFLSLNIAESIETLENSPSIFLYLPSLNFSMRFFFPLSTIQNLAKLALKYLTRLSTIA